LNYAEQELRGILQKSTAQLGQMPEGYLRDYFRKSTRYFTQEIRLEDGRSRKGINQKPELIERLAGKDFLMMMAEAAEWNIRLMENLAESYQSMDPADVVARMGRAAQSLPVETILAASQSAVWTDPDQARRERIRQLQKWAKSPFEQSTYKPEEKIRLTSSGIYVRSKSEALIVEKLKDYGAPNRYEEILWLEGKDFAPDFTFRDAQGEPFFWEHAGMMGKEQYVRRHKYKMDVYERNGIVPWKNLILTYNTVDGAINTGLIDSIVRFQVLPRL
ncbi:MAG: hypothetical protein IJ128_07045, partial [Firmicutes bacterium]|nr:hypothetical protein [Bacillota bacterium]